MLNQIIKGIQKYGRPIEKIKLLQILEGNHEHQLLDELSKYQNEDGGFGHGLEPDNLDPNSSPLQTWCAINYLREIKFDQNHPLVIKLFNYLYQSFDHEIKRWPLYMKTVIDYPHAPWWNYKETNKEYNPTASLIGFILKYAPKDHIVYELGLSIKDDAIQYLIDLNIYMDMHELKCFIEMIHDLKDVDNGSLMIAAEEAILKRIDQTLEKDPQKWFKSYGAKPSYLIPYPNSIGFDLYRDLRNQEIQLLLDNRNEEGLWTPPFTWDNEVTNKIWTAIIALEYLKLIIEHHRA